MRCFNSYSAGFSVLAVFWAGADAATTCKPIRDAPRTECNVVGLVPGNYSLAEPQVVENVNDCAALCARRVYDVQQAQVAQNFGSYENLYMLQNPNYCQSFGYDPSTKVCRLGQLDITSVSANSSSSTAYYAPSCFDCGRFCAQRPYGSQLLDNGGAEQQLIGPWEKSHFSIRPGGHDSAHAFHCVPGRNPKIRSRREPCYLHQQVNMCDDQFYALQFDYKIVHEKNSKAVVQMVYAFGGQVKIKKIEPAESGDWKTARILTKAYGALLKSPPIASYYPTNKGGPAFWFEMLSSDKTPGADTVQVFVDNVRVSLVSLHKALKNPGVSVIRNGGFEQKPRYFPTWSSTEPQEIKIVSPGIHSAHAISITYKGQYFKAPTVQQNVDLTSHSYYLLTFDAKLYSTQQYSWTLEPNLPGWARLGFSPLALSFGKANSTLSYSIPFQAESDSAFLSLFFSMGVFGKKKVGKLILDNFKTLKIDTSTVFL